MVETPRRVTVVTGAHSGIGRSTVELLRLRGEAVIGIDLAGSDISADLATASGRASALQEVQRLGSSGVHSLIACAGVASADGRRVVAVNYFGAVTMAAGIAPLIAASESPRIVIVSSSAMILPVDEGLVDLCLAGDEAAALESAEGNALAYSSSKNAVTRWIRRVAARLDWAGRGILLNGVAPGLVQTPMTAPLLATAEGRALLAASAPYAVKQAAQAADIAPLLVFLASADNRYMVGQVPFCDGGKDVLLRGDKIV